MKMKRKHLVIVSHITFIYFLATLKDKADMAVINGYEVL